MDQHKALYITTIRTLITMKGLQLAARSAALCAKGPLQVLEPNDAGCAGYSCATEMRRRHAGSKSRTCVTSMLKD